MNAKSIFIGMFMVVLVVNFIYISATPTRLFDMGFGALVGFALSILPIIALGTSIMGSYILSDQSQKILISLVFFLNLMFQVEVYEIYIGMGLMNNVYLALGGETFLSIGFLVTSFLTAIIFVTGLLSVVE